MKIKTIPVSDIVVGTRRRDEFGDLHGLAASIEKYGLLQPIVIDNESNLVAGERRLRAFQILERSEIPCRVYEDLTPQERLEMELEENNQRLDLTPFEQSKQILQDAEKVEEIISATVKEKDSRGRKAERKAPKKDIAQAIGKSESTLVRAEQHVKAVEAHPELKTAPQKEAIQKAKASGALPTKKIQSVQNRPLAKPGVSKGGGQFNRWNSKVRDFKSELKQAGTAENLTGTWTESERFTFFDTLKELRDMVDEFTIDLGEHLNEMREAS